MDLRGMAKALMLILALVMLVCAAMALAHSNNFGQGVAPRHLNDSSGVTGNNDTSRGSYDFGAVEWKCNAGTHHVGIHHWSLRLHIRCTPGGLPWRHCAPKNKVVS